MGTTGKHHRNVTVSNLDGTFTFYEVSKQLGCIALLKTPNLLCQHGIERIGVNFHPNPATLISPKPATLFSP